MVHLIIDFDVVINKSKWWFSTWTNLNSNHNKLRLLLSFNNRCGLGYPSTKFDGYIHYTELWPWPLKKKKCSVTDHEQPASLMLFIFYAFLYCLVVQAPGTQGILSQIAKLSPDWCSSNLGVFSLKCQKWFQFFEQPLYIF